MNIQSLQLIRHDGQDAIIRTKLQYHIDQLFQR